MGDSAEELASLLYCDPLLCYLLMFSANNRKGSFTRSDSWFRKLEAGVQTFRFQGSVFVVRMSEGHLSRVHTIRFSELTKNLQFGAKTITGISCCYIYIRFLKIMDPCVGKSFSMCLHDPILGTNKNRILKNGSCERSLR